MTNITITRAAARSIGIAALACLGLGGCSQSGSGGNGEATSTYADLEVQLQNCASDGLTCWKAANCDQAAEQVCKDDFKTCRENTRAAYHAFHDAVKDCFSQARACVSDAGDSDRDGGVSGFHACRDQFKTCVQDNRPAPPPAGPCLQGFRECVQTDDQDRRDCLTEAHTCFVNRLPMCGRNGHHGHDADGGTAGSGGTGSGGAGQ